MVENAHIPAHTKSMMLSALLAVLVAAPAHAGKMPSCIKPDKAGAVPDLAVVRACQKNGKKLVMAAYEKQQKKPAPIWLREKIEDQHRSKVREFLAKYPHKASMATEEIEPPAKGENKSSYIMATLMSYLGKYAGKMKSMMGMSGGSKRIGNPTAADLEAARSLKVITDAAQKNGLNLQKHKMESMLAPGKTLQKRMDKYHKSLKNNLDPSMKKFYRKDKKSIK